MQIEFLTSLPGAVFKSMYSTFDVHIILVNNTCIFKTCFQLRFFFSDKDYQAENSPNDQWLAKVIEDLESKIVIFLFQAN